MDEVFFPRITPDPSLLSPDANTQGDVLDQESYNDLYILAGEEGLPYFARLGGHGEVELYLVFESVDSFSEQTRDAVSVEFKTYQNRLLAVIWTLSDPLHPLGFPLSFDIQKEDDRYMALKLLEQPYTQLHYLAYEDEQLTHIYSEAIHFSKGEVSQAQEMIRSLYAGTPHTLPKEAEVREEATETIPAISLPVSVLKETGTAYVLHYSRMLSALGEEAAQHLLMSTVQQAVWVMRRHARSDVREASFTVWAAEREELLYLVVTPSLSLLFEVIHTSGDESNPFSRFLLTLPAFIRSEQAAPLKLGAFPLLRYESGRLYHLELDVQVQAHLSRLHEEAFSGVSNPYL
jgi:hypothetical protein